MTIQTSHLPGVKLEFSEDKPLCNFLYRWMHMHKRIYTRTSMYRLISAVTPSKGNKEK